MSRSRRKFPGRVDTDHGPNRKIAIRSVRRIIKQLLMNPDLWDDMYDLDLYYKLSSRYEDSTWGYKWNWCSLDLEDPEIINWAVKILRK